MESYHWYTVRKALKQLGVESGWILTSNWLTFVTPKDKVVTMHRDDCVRTETLHLLLDKLEIDHGDFEREYRAAQE